VIERIAKSQAAPLTHVNPTAEQAQIPGSVALPLLGWHQKVNAALAAATVHLLNDTIPVSEAQIRQGLAATRWPGRLQVITARSGQRVLLDGAHNPAGAATLRDAVSHSFAGEKPALILGILEDKNFKLICEILAPLADKILLIPVTSHRTISPDQLLPICLAANPHAEIQICPDLPAALAASADRSFVIITGSLYLIGEALERLEGMDPSGTPGRTGTNESERALNEWSAGKVNSR
jgi:dihydrofolate synthase/folylpolyglutamate synthase